MADMGDADDSEMSFDPRHWRLGPTLSSSATPKPAEPSYDPRSWVNQPPRVPPFREKDRRPLSLRMMPLTVPWRHMVAAGGTALVLAVGVAFAWLARPPTAVRAPAETALPPIAAISHRMLTVEGPRAITSSLVAVGITPTDAEMAGGEAAAALGGAPGDIRLIFDMAGPPGSARLAALEATRVDGSGLALTRDGARHDEPFRAVHYTARLSTRIEAIRGKLDTASFYSAAVAAGLRDTLVSDFASAFAFDFDFQREVGPGSLIIAGYEQRYSAAGDAVGVPVLVYASLATLAKTRTLYRFAGPGDKTAGWYDINGHSTVRALMRTPIDGARISSPFGMRNHPVLGFMKMHKGTDFAAPVGTPIFAAGNGTVEFAGPKGFNGNYVKLRHDNGWETLYLHMNRIWPQIVAGARVSQGEQIGEVGTTGRSTGPHLHYEVHIGGEPVDPMGVDTGSGKALAGSALAAFKRERARIESALARSHSLPDTVSALGAAPVRQATRTSSPSSR